MFNDLVINNLQIQLNDVVEKISKDSQNLQRENVTLRQRLSKEIKHNYDLHEVNSEEEIKSFKQQFSGARDLTEEQYDDRYNLKVEKINNSVLNARYELEKDILKSKHKSLEQSLDINVKELWTGPYEDLEGALLFVQHGYIGQWMAMDSNAELGGTCARMTERANPKNKNTTEYWIQWSVMTGTSSEYKPGLWQKMTFEKGGPYQVLETDEDSLYNPTIKTYGIFVPSQMTPNYLVQETSKGWDDDADG